MTKAEDFNAGDRVRYTGPCIDGRTLKPYAGQLATVIRPIKSRKRVHIKWDDASQATFEAGPSNLEHA
jgi:hypothetical protein